MNKKTHKSRERRTKFLRALKPEKEPGIEIKPRKAIIIGVFSCKGGVGKTTTAANLSTCLHNALDGGVLVVDANLTAPNLGLHFGEMNPKNTIHDVLTNKIPIEKAITKCDGLHALLGSIAFGEDVHSVDLRSHLDILRSSYKVIILDSAPGVGPEVVSAMKACDEVIIVTNPYIPTVASTIKTFGAAERYKISVIGTIVNQIRGEPFELRMEDVRKALGWPILAAIPEDSKVREATSVGVPVVRHAPDSPAAKRFLKLCDSVLDHIGKM